MVRQKKSNSSPLRLWLLMGERWHEDVPALATAKTLATKCGKKVTKQIESLAFATVQEPKTKRCKECWK